MSEELVGCVVVLFMYFVFAIVLVILWKLLKLGDKPDLKDIIDLHEYAVNENHKRIITGMIFKTVYFPKGIKILFIPLFAMGSLIIASVCTPNIVPPSHHVRQILLDLYSFLLQARGIKPDFE